MIGRYILFYFSLGTIRAQDTNPPILRSKVEWVDDKSMPMYLLTRPEANIFTATNRPSNVPLWDSKDLKLSNILPVTNMPNPSDISTWTPKDLKFLNFLFSDDEIASAKWSNNLNKFLIPNPKDTVHDIPKSFNKNNLGELKKSIDNAMFKEDNEDNRPDPNSMDINKTLFVPKKPNSDEELIKDKIFSLAKQAENDLDVKVNIIEKTNTMFKMNNYYKLGFIVSYINTTHNALKDLMRHVGRNQQNWDVLKILDAYVQIKRTKEFLTDMLSVINHLQSRQSMQPTATEKKREEQGIAWSYYDDQ